MAVSISPLFDPRAERSLLEVNQQLCFQLAMSEQQYRDPKEKLSTVEAAANSLANQLQKYNNIQDTEEYCGEIQVNTGA
ncbi:putative neuroblastoma breakpoint family member 5 [Tupaia chinensis]|uniref:putative neuroblastoma breakpoint family member 5 n=1 Tax=Tupaia chinensis TaxID=246437 RepID=UPI0003C91B57|nr:putative neuroblastoma breakpoint family member 5 [Tupaia chinensis]